MKEKNIKNKMYKKYNKQNGYKIYQIYHYFSKDVDKYSIYISTKMKRNTIADILAGLQFYLEDNTPYGYNEIDENMASYFLCKFYNCKVIYDKNELKALKDNGYNFGKIDIYSDIEFRALNEDYADKCVYKIKKHLETEYVTKLKLFFSDSNYFCNKRYLEYLTPKEILKKY